MHFCEHLPTTREIIFLHYARLLLAPPLPLPKPDLHSGSLRSLAEDVATIFAIPLTEPQANARTRTPAAAPRHI
jgi:hypothetical protein